MKKILLAATAALAITSCSQNEEFEVQGTNNEINVGTVVKNSVRAIITNDGNFKAFKLSSFIVDKDQAYSTIGLGAAYMDGVEYTGEKGSWEKKSDTNVYYWPSSKNVQFFGYPADATLAVGGTGYPTLSFNIEAESASQKDIVVAAESTNKVDNGTNQVNLSFKHILTKINFSYKPADGYTYTITELKVKGVKGAAATYTFADDPANGSWVATAPETLQTYEYTVNVGAIDNGYYPLDSENGSLMLLPQSIPADQAEILVTYTATKGSYSYEATDKSVKIKASSWGVGKSIRYKLSLPAGDAEIGVDTSVGGWEAETPGETE